MSDSKPLAEKERAEIRQSAERIAECLGFLGDPRPAKLVLRYEATLAREIERRKAAEAALESIVDWEQGAVGGGDPFPLVDEGMYFDSHQVDKILEWAHLHDDEEE